MPVFETILSNASQICDAPMAWLVLVDETRRNFVDTAFYGEEVRSWRVGEVHPLEPPSLIAAAILESRTINLADVAETIHYKERVPTYVRLVEEEGLRSRLYAPLVANGQAIGCILLSRRNVRPFTDADAALVETFAEQAVIAIENVRQFRELQTRLQREAATREILEVISRSREDEKPVFDVILKNAARLCNAPIARLHLLSDDGAHHRIAAHWGDDMRSLEIGEKWPMDERHLIPRTIREARAVHTQDLAETDLYQKGEPLYQRLVDEEGLRTRLTVPLLHGDQAFGCIALSRRHVSPFRDEDIELVKTFAAQAVIAIDGVGQFRELQIRLDREAATREILQVISRSRDDEAPVFDIILKSLMRLCDTPQAALYLVSQDCQSLEIVASRGKGREKLDRLRRAQPIPLANEHSSFVQAFRLKEPLHIQDIQATPRWRSSGDSALKTAVELANMRTVLQVPLLSGDTCIGVLCVYRNEIKPYSEDEIALHRMFAAQAVIAIENVRQFKSLQARTEEVQALNQTLEARVEAQVGEIERMGRLKRFLSPAVAEAVVSSGSDKLLSSHRALIAVLFCDIRGFTAFCETAEPEETIEVLQTYHEAMGQLINAHGAGVDHRMGDGIMVLFNDPLPREDPAGDALRLALAMRERMAILCSQWRRLGHRLGFGVGISLGYATVGMVGSEGRFEYTASGTTVNLAARLCDEAGDGEILLSPRACAAVEKDFEAELRGEMNLKGIQALVPVYRVIGPRKGLSEL
jgi:class 3 adenylate cyclase